MCEIKSAQPMPRWTADKPADIFLIAFPDSLGRLYAVPRDRVNALYSAAYSVRLTRSEATAAAQARPSLAPFAVLEKDYPYLVSRLAHGEDAPRPVHGRTTLDWKVPATRPLGDMFHFKCPFHELSFRAVIRLYSWLRRRHPTLRFHHVCTQPLAGDFLVEFGPAKVRVQHKVQRSESPVGGKFHGPMNAFDFLMVHHGPVDHGYLSVTPRNVTVGHGFSYDDDGADRLVQYLDTHKEEAFKASIEASARLLDEAVPLLSADRDPSYASQRREEEYDGRMRLRAHQLAMRMYQYINKDPDGLELDLACIYLNWDQEHPFGAAIVVRHPWTSKERDMFRTSQVLPASLHDLLPSLERRECAVLRFSMREFRHLYRSTSVFPLQQLHAELPLTDQKFFLIAPPDETLTNRMPETIMLFPSELIRFPAKVKEIWRENKDRLRHGAGAQAKYQLALLKGHTQEGAGIVGSMLRPGTALPDFWVTPRSALQHLDELLQGGLGPDMAIRPLEAYDLARLKRFRKADYITNTRGVLQASIDYGSVRPNNDKGFRPYGYWHKQRVREAKRKAEVRGEGEERTKPGGRRPRTAKRRREARKAPSIG